VPATSRWSCRKTGCGSKMGNQSINPASKKPYEKLLMLNVSDSKFGGCHSPRDCLGKQGKLCHCGNLPFEIGHGNSEHQNPADIGPNCSMLSNVISPPTVISRHCSNTGETGPELPLTVAPDRPYVWNPAVPSPGNRIGFREPE